MAVKRKQMGGAASVAMLALISACTVIGSKVPGWPQLKVVEHWVSPSEILDQCQKYAFFGGIAEACAEFDLKTGICDIYFNKDFPPSERVVEHERMHCEGYEHVGGTELTELLKTDSK